MSFFIRTGNSIKQNEKNFQKQKQKEKRKSTGASGKSKHQKFNDEEIESEDEEASVVKTNNTTVYQSDDDDNETAQEKKIRLAKIYLEEIERRERKLKENGDVGKEDIANYLQADLKEKASKTRRLLGDSCIGFDANGMKTLRCKEHHLPVTCVVVSYDNKYIYSGSKDSGIVKWCLKEGKKLKSVKSKDMKKNSKKHFGIVLSLAISSDDQFLVSGCSNKEVIVWNPETLDHTHTFNGHKGPVTGLAFQKNHHTLFSVSMDKCVKVWNLTEMSYVESLFGHQKGITAVDAFLGERAISAGEDSSVHLWKIMEESQLIYNASGSVDCVKFINDSFFFSCGNDGSLCLWGTLKKRPLYSITSAHGVDESNNEPHWVTSVCALKNTDLVASGSSSGCIKLWKCAADFKKLEPLFEIPVKGFVNGLDFSPDGRHLTVAVGSEHRLGRWKVIEGVKSCVLVIPLLRNS